MSGPAMIKTHITKDIHNQIKIVERMRDNAQQTGWDNSDREDQEKKDYRSRENIDRFTNAEDSPAGDSTIGSGLSGGGATSSAGINAVGQQENIKGNLREGMQVLAKNNGVVGTVKEIRQFDFLVDREMARDIYIPYDAVGSVSEQVLLDYDFDEIEQQDWQKPDLLGR